MAIRRQTGPPRVVMSGIDGTDCLYDVVLTAVPSRVWKAAFLRPPARLTRGRLTLDVGRVVLEGATIHFRAAPPLLEARLKRIDRWIAYANLVVEE